MIAATTFVTLRVVITAFIAVLHLVNRKLSEWETPSVTHARNVHSSLLIQSSYLT